MGKQINYTRILILAIFLLTLADAACTAAGVSLGIILEGNPIMQVPMHEHPVFTAALVCLYVGVLLALLEKFSSRCRYIVPLLTVVFLVKVAIIGLHLGWIIPIG